MEQDKKYYRDNLEKFKKYREENIERINAKAKKYREEHPEYFKKKRREHYEKEKKLGIDRKKEWVEKNRDKHREYTREYSKTRMEEDLQFKLIVNHRKRVSYIFKEIKFKKKRPSKEILGAEIDDVINHIEEMFENGMSLDNYGEWHIDHKVPLASADDEEELEALFYYKNIQPMWAELNLSKGASYDVVDKLEYLKWYSANVKELYK